MDYVVRIHYMGRKDLSLILSLFCCSRRAKKKKKNSKEGEKSLM